jgi:hypothetical protein
MNIGERIIDGYFDLSANRTLLQTMTLQPPCEPEKKSPKKPKKWVPRRLRTVPDNIHVDISR